MADGTRFCNDGKFAEIAVFYLDVRQRIIAAEREEEEQRLSITAISELRNALDHLMRAKAAEVGAISGDALSGLSPGDYIDKNLDKALGHLYRASYDAYDIISIELIAKIDKLLETISRRTLYEVIPDAADRITAPYTKSTEVLKQAKSDKDVESENDRGRFFKAYEDATGALATILSYLQSVEVDLQRAEKEHREEEGRKAGEREAQQRADRRQSVLQWVIPIVTAILGAVVTYLLTS